MSGTIIALGGLSADHDDSALRHVIVESAKKHKPRICHVPIASGDYELFISLFYEQYPPSICVPSHLELLRDVSQDPAAVLAAQDIIYLGGGSTPVLVAAMRVLGLDRVLRAVWRRGGVLCGHSAGAHVWFEGCITDSLGPDLRVFPDGLGLAGGTCVAHYDHDRAAILEAALRAGELCAASEPSQMSGYRASDGRGSLGFRRIAELAVREDLRGSPTPSLKPRTGQRSGFGERGGHRASDVSVVGWPGPDGGNYSVLHQSGVTRS